MKFSRGDKLLLLAEDRDSYSFGDRIVPEVSFNGSGLDECRKPLHMLIFSGSSRKIRFMLEKLDAYAVTGADILVAGSLPQEEGDSLLTDLEMRNSSLAYIRMDRTDPEQIEALKPETFDSIMVISGKALGMSDETADSECLVTLLVLKSIERKVGDSWEATVVAEIRNPRNRRLASAASIDDFVISNEVCSMIMAQPVIEPHLGDVYEEIFDPSGCEVQLRCPSVYVSRSFAQMSAEGLQKKEIVLGWLTGTGSDAEVHLNPDRQDVMPDEDSVKIVVIAER